MFDVNALSQFVENNSETPKQESRQPKKATPNRSERSGQQQSLLPSLSSAPVPPLSSPSPSSDHDDKDVRFSDFRKQLQGQNSNSSFAFEYTGIDSQVTKEALESDFFPTPEEVVIAAIPIINVAVSPRVILDVGAGETGVWGRLAKQRFPEAKLVGVELRNVAKPDGFDVWIPNTSLFDYFPDAEDRPDWIIGNPPFSLACEFIEHGLNIVTPTGQIDLFLRSQFNGSQDRFYQFWNRIKLKHEYYCASRVSFIKKGGRKLADVWDYSIFEFAHGYDSDVWTCSRWDYKSYRPKKRSSRKGARTKKV